MKVKAQKNNSSKIITRRKFLKSSLAITAGITLAGCSDISFSPVEPKSTEGQIIIVGAGLSGLAAAYELTKAGYDVRILEANDRIGGRVFTLREPFTNGQFAEAGAARIPVNHNHTLNYAAEFDLQLDPFYPRTGNFIRYINGNRNIIPNNSFLTQRPWGGSVPHSEYYKIRGGTDKLPNAFAEKLSDKITVNTPVKMIDQSDEKITIKTTNGRTFTAERVIVTVPLTVLNKIEFVPPLSSKKLEASNGGYNYASSTRVYLQNSSRFWMSENLNGWGTTDWPEEMWQPTFDQNGDGGILMNYASNSRADELDMLSNEERIDSLINRWTKIYPRLEDYYNRGTSFSWIQQEWANGAYARPSYSQMNRFDNHIGSVEGKIHFAGEHISNYHGWMQGALASGLQVVNEITEAEVYV